MAEGSTAIYEGRDNNNAAVAFSVIDVVRLERFENGDDFDGSKSEMVSVLLRNGGSVLVVDLYDLLLRRWKEALGA